MKTIKIGSRHCVFVIMSVSVLNCLILYDVQYCYNLILLYNINISQNCEPVNAFVRPWWYYKGFRWELTVADWKSNMTNVGIVNGLTWLELFLEG